MTPCSNTYQTKLLGKYCKKLVWNVRQCATNGKSLYFVFYCCLGIAGIENNIFAYHLWLCILMYFSCQNEFFFVLNDDLVIVKTKMPVLKFIKLVTLIWQFVLKSVYFNWLWKLHGSLIKIKLAIVLNKPGHVPNWLFFCIKISRLSLPSQILESPLAQ